MSAIRELVITYGSYVTNSTTRQVTNFTRGARDRDRQSIEFDLVISGAASAAAFASEVSTTETAFGNPYQDVTVALGATNVIAVTQSGNTGLDAMPSISKPGQVGDTARSRVYHVRIEWGLPASWNLTYPGLRDLAVTLDYTPARRLGWTIAGTFTAISGSDAKAQYEAQIATLTTDTASWLSISSYELVDESSVQVSTNRKTATFARTFRELLLASAAESVVEQSLIVTRDQRGTESQGNAVPLQGWSAVYSAWVDKSVTTDLTSLYQTVKTYAMARVQNALNSSQVALMSDAPSFDQDENRITLNLSGMAVDPQSSGLLDLSVTTTLDTKLPVDFDPAWSGNPYAAFVYTSVAILTRTIVERRRDITTGGVVDDAGGGGGGGFGGGLVGRGPINTFFGFPGSTPIFSDGAAVASRPPASSFFDIDLVTVYPPDADQNGSGGVDDGGGGGGGPPPNNKQQPGAPTWILVSTQVSSRPGIRIGRPNFGITVRDVSTTTVERYIAPIQNAGTT